MPVQRLAAAVPSHVREVCSRIAAAGHQAVVVGGCVRDVLLDRQPGDWDVATSAHPEQVVALFKHVIETGLQHGTVTVVMGRGEHTHVEVTTYRGEGAYSDARRPDSVTFGVPLREDLARRDLVVNAMAFDPASNELIDPFGGQDDIAARRLRAVGSAVDRFTEDGLRVMRAVRFAAQLEFDLDPATEAGIPPALPSLAKVSRERVAVELRKILDAREPSRGLRPALRTGIVASILPALQVDDTDGWLARIDRAAPEVRLAAMFAPLSTEIGSPIVDRALVKQVAEILRDLKFSNAELELASAVVGVAHFATLPSWSDEEIRRALSRIDKAKRQAAIDLWESHPAEQLATRAQKILDAKQPLGVGDLVVTGKDLMSELKMKPGPAIGRVLALLLDHVLEEPTRNERDALLAKAQELEVQLAP